MLRRLNRFLPMMLVCALLASCHGAHKASSKSSASKSSSSKKTPLGGSEGTTTPKAANADRHKEFMKLAGQGGIDLLFVGDSITDFWRAAGIEVWNKTWAPLHAANFGINGEHVEQTLWRAENGELDGYKAKAVVLMIGTNNLKASSNEAIVDGIKALCAQIQKHQPDAKLLLLGIFPREADPKSHWRPRIKEINAELAKLDDGKSVFFMDIGDKFLEKDGTISKETMEDGLHPTAKGYQIWADATLPKVKELMGEK